MKNNSSAGKVWPRDLVKTAGLLRYIDTFEIDTVTWTKRQPRHITAGVHATAGVVNGERACLFLGRL